VAQVADEGGQHWADIPNVEFLRKGHDVSLVSAMLRLPWFIAWAIITAIRLSSSANFLA
jgi:hypothetical protein